LIDELPLLFSEAIVGVKPISSHELEEIGKNASWRETVWSQNCSMHFGNRRSRVWWKTRPLAYDGMQKAVNRKRELASNIRSWKGGK